MADLPYVLGIDYGAKRIGLAIAHTIARLPRPLLTLPGDSDVLAELARIIREEQIGRLVVGMPRSMDGSTHGQAAAVQAFIDTLDGLGLPVTVVDETLSSVEAEALLARNKKKGPIEKGDIDAMAAALILERYFEEHSELGA